MRRLTVYQANDFNDNFMTILRSPAAKVSRARELPSKL
jgi:hypothetical protein